MYSPGWSEVQAKLLCVDFTAQFRPLYPIIMHIKDSSLLKITPEKKISLKMFGRILTGCISLCSWREAGHWILKNCKDDKNKVIAIDDCIRLNPDFYLYMYEYCLTMLNSGSVKNDILLWSLNFENLRSKDQVKLFNRLRVCKQTKDLTCAAKIYIKPELLERTSYAIKHGWKFLHEEKIVMYKPGERILKDKFESKIKKKDPNTRYITLDVVDEIRRRK